MGLSSGSNSRYHKTQVEVLRLALPSCFDLDREFSFPDFVPISR